MFEDWHASLLNELRVARLGTIAADGRPHLVPVCYAVVDGLLVISVDEKPKRPGELERIRNIRRDSRVTFLADRYSEDWARLAWLRIDGMATVLAAGSAYPAALNALRARYSQYASMTLEALPLISITPTRVAAWRAQPGVG